MEAGRGKGGSLQTGTEDEHSRKEALQTRPRDRAESDGSKARASLPFLPPECFFLLWVFFLVLQHILRGSICFS